MARQIKRSDQDKERIKKLNEKEIKNRFNIDSKDIDSMAQSLGLDLSVKPATSDTTDTAVDNATGKDLDTGTEKQGSNKKTTTNKKATSKLKATANKKDTGTEKASSSQKASGDNEYWWAEDYRWLIDYINADTAYQNAIGDDKVTGNQLARGMQNYIAHRYMEKFSLLYGVYKNEELSLQEFGLMAAVLIEMSDIQDNFSINNLLDHIKGYKRTVYKTLSELEDKKLISIKRQPGKTSDFKIFSLKKKYFKSLLSDETIKRLIEIYLRECGVDMVTTNDNITGSIIDSTDLKDSGNQIDSGNELFSGIDKDSSINLTTCIQKACEGLLLISQWRNIKLFNQEFILLLSDYFKEKASLQAVIKLLAWAIYSSEKTSKPMMMLKKLISENQEIGEEYIHLAKEIIKIDFCQINLEEDPSKQELLKYYDLLSLSLKDNSRESMVSELNVIQSEIKQIWIEIYDNYEYLF